MAETTSKESTSVKTPVKKSTTKTYCKIFSRAKHPIELKYDGVSLMLPPRGVITHIGDDKVILEKLGKITDLNVVIAKI